MKKDIIIYPVLGIVLALLVIFVWNYKSKPTPPVIGPDGKISGNYTIEGIMSLGQPYECTFEKSDGISAISGTLLTDGKNLQGQFRIKTDSVKDEFNSFLIEKDGTAYAWTSLQNTGYKSPVAKSASANASPGEQAQIVGTEDKTPFECKPWQNPDSTTFDIPTWITFLESKN
jgi:hypothetical protein